MCIRDSAQRIGHQIQPQIILVEIFRRQGGVKIVGIQLIVENRFGQLLPLDHRDAFFGIAQAFQLVIGCNFRNGSEREDQHDRRGDADQAVKYGFADPSAPSALDVYKIQRRC